MAREDNLGPYAKKVPIEYRFWQKVDMDGPIPSHFPSLGKCWIWTANSSTRGYGVINKDGDNCRAHRVSWEISNGPIPDGLCVLHSCDNPPCVRPSHLFLGTVQDNSLDMVSKGRAVTWEKIKHRRTYSGQDHPRALLDNVQVVEIRNTYAAGGTSYSRLAKEYGVHKETIRAIIKRRNWSNV